MDSNGLTPPEDEKPESEPQITPQVTDVETPNSEVPVETSAEEPEKVDDIGNNVSDAESSPVDDDSIINVEDNVPNESEPQKELTKKKNNDIRVKTRAQMNAHARANKKAHMYKGKKKGTESEEEPLSEDEEDPWVTEKLNLLKSKGII